MQTAESQEAGGGGLSGRDARPDDEGWELKKTLQSSRLIPLLSYPPIRMGKLRTTERKALVQDPAINQCKLPSYLL